MPNVAVLTNDLQYEFTYKITTDQQELECKLKKFNTFLDGIRAAGQTVIHLQLIHDPNDPSVQRRYRNRAAGIPALRDIPEQQFEIFNKMVVRKINAPITTSMGRLFDGISALMGICSKVEYEAQAAIEMEALLQRDFSMAKPFKYAINETDGCLEVDYRPLVNELVRLLQTQIYNLSELSRRFHSTIVDIIEAVCQRLVDRFEVKQIVLSGGVFCNEFILINALNCLELRGFKSYCHQLVPTNDGGISLGQVVVAAARINQEALMYDGE